MATLFLATAPAQAKNDTIQRAPVPNWATPSELMPVPPDVTGLAFVRRNDTLIHLDEQGQAQFQDYRIRILHPTALQLGNLAIAWNPAAGAPAVHSVRIYRQDEVIDVLKSTKFEILRREDKLEEATLNGTLTAVLRVPDLRVGDELEVALTIRSKDPTLGGKDAGLLALAAEPPPGRFRLGLSWSAGYEPQIRMTPDIAGAARRDASNLTLDFDNPAARPAPKDAPPRFGWQRAVEYSDFPGWESVSRHFAPLFSKAAKFAPGSPLKAEAARIAKAQTSPLERASAALNLVQQQVRYIYVGLDGGNLMPAFADETWKRRYGDCKGKTALLLGLLSELGIEAEPVLVNNGGTSDGLDARLANPGLFDHVLVRARIDGSTYWLDGTLPPVAGPSKDPVMPYGWVLPLTDQGKTIEQLPWRMPETPDEVTLYEIDARKGFDVPAQIRNTLIVRGIKGLQQQVELSGLTSTQLLSGLRKELIGDFWQTVEDVQWRYDEKARASVMSISGTGVMDWDDENGGGKSLTLPGGGFSPPEKRVRPDDQDQKVPFYNASEFSCRVTTVRLPAATQASRWSVNDGFDTHLFGGNYYRAFSLRDGAISMIRGFRVEQREIGAETAKRDNGRIASFDNSMALITYDPGRGIAQVKANPAVPATSDIDWASNDVPCLSSLAQRLNR